MALTFRDEKGSALSAAEVDANFRTLQAMIEEVSENVPVGVSITNFTTNGATFTVHLSDGTTRGPFALPVAPSWRWRGALTPNAAYTEFDVFSFQNATDMDGVYLVLGAYASPVDLADFDPDVTADDTEGGPALEKVLGTVAESVRLFSIYENHDLVASEAGFYFQCFNEEPCAIIVPDGSAGIPAGSVFTFRWSSTGSVSFVPDGGATITTPETLNLRKAGSTGTLIYVGGDVWDLAGDLELLPEESTEALTEGTEAATE